MAHFERDWIKGVARLLVLSFLLILSGCKVELYSKLSEAEANEMLAVLMSSGILAEKQSAAESFAVLVEDNDLVRAISTLKAKGYPKEERQSIGSIFEKSGIISSPFEERVRYIYALGEEVAQTLGEIDGVLIARVHVVLPQEPALGQAIKPSSAAIFIKHEANVDLEFLVPQIKRLVSSGIEGLDYAAVTVVLTEATAQEVSPQSAVDRRVTVLPGLLVPETGSGVVRGIVYGAFGFVLLLLVAGVFGTIAFVSRKRRIAERAGFSSAGSILEPS